MISSSGVGKEGWLGGFLEQWNYFAWCYNDGYTNDALVRAHRTFKNTKSET